MKGSTTRWVIVLVALLAATYALMPTFLDVGDGQFDGDVANQEQEWVQWLLDRQRPLTLGLDLQGGLLLQYNVLVDKAVQDKLDRMAEDMGARLRSEKEGLQVEPNHPSGETYIDLTFGDAENMSMVDDDFLSFFPSMTKSEVDDNTLRLTMNSEFIEETKSFAVQQAIETIRQRVDALGVAEPSITRKSKSDIVIQLPGLAEDDIERAKNLIGQTAQLEFRMVDDEGTNSFFNKFSGKLPEGFALRQIPGGLSVTHRDKQSLEVFFEGKVPEDHIIGYEHVPVYEDAEKKELDEEQSYWRTYYVKAETELTGDYIQDARVAIDPQFNKPYVAITFDSKGAELFGELSSNNVGKRMAIMLDDKVQSAPVFEEAITGGRARITMGTDRAYSEIQQDSQDLVIVLRHGALPAPIEKQFETVVGPSLGQDSINSSMLALLVGAIGIVLFMLFYYRGSGVISTIALFLNLLFIMAVLAALGATLTLPGIAGIILTVGMAVDANVIIYERIREEVRAGDTPREAVQIGYSKALSAVLDANITTAIAGFVLLQFGTGPIRGFAVTLLIGIAGTIFTAVFISRLLFDTFLVREDSDSLSIGISGPNA
jgi:preprotein translocase subunit SecD